MTALVVRDKNTDLATAGIVATVLCALNIIDVLDGGSVFRDCDAHGGSIRIECDEAKLLQVKAGFVAIGFTVLTVTC
jgi:hypothetical protein